MLRRPTSSEYAVILYYIFKAPYLQHFHETAHSTREVRPVFAAFQSRPGLTTPHGVDDTGDIRHTADLSERQYYPLMNYPNMVMVLVSFRSYRI